VNHAGHAERVRWFVEATRAAGATDLLFLACVPLVATREGIELLMSFTGLALPDGYLDALASARDPFTEGVRQAVAYARAVLDVSGVVGVDLSTASPIGSEEIATRAAIAVIEELRG